MEKLNVAIADDNDKMVEILGRMIEEDNDLDTGGKSTQRRRNMYHYQGKRTGCGSSGYYYAKDGWTDSNGTVWT